MTQCRRVDFIVGGERTKDAKELLYARQKLVLVAKAFQLQAIDLVHIDYKGCSDCTVIVRSNNRYCREVYRDTCRVSHTLQESYAFSVNSPLSTH